MRNVGVFVSVVFGRLIGSKRKPVTAPMEDVALVINPVLRKRLGIAVRVEHRHVRRPGCFAKLMNLLQQPLFRMKVWSAMQSTSTSLRQAGAGAWAPALRAAFPHTIPILAGFVFLGITCGIYSISLGLPWWTPTLMSTLIFAGSAEFMVASMLTGAFNPLQAFVVTFIINARHLFYGISMLERFRGLGAKRPYLIFGMCDETFSINYSTEPPAGVDRGWFMLFVTLLNQLYWVIGCTLGSLCGSALALNVEGISFAMTALFVVIFLDQWLKDTQHLSAIAGIAAAAVTLVALGADDFMIPAMVLIVVAVTALRGRIEPAYEARETQSAGESSTANATQTAADNQDMEGIQSEPMSDGTTQGGDAS